MRLRRPVATMTFSVGLALSLAAWACVGEDPAASAPAPDAALEAPPRTEQDGGRDDAPVLCDVATPFRPGELVELGGIGSHDTALKLSADERTIYFTSTREADASAPHPEDVWTASRGGLTEKFGIPRRLPFATGFYEAAGPPTLDGTAVYITTDEKGPPGRFEIVVASLGSPTRASLPALDAGAASNANPGATRDGSLYFVSDRAGTVGNSGRDLYFAAYEGGALKKPVAISELNTSAWEDTPTPSADGLVLYWFSTREDLGAPNGSGEIYVASRARVTDAFGPARRVSELSTLGLEAPGWLSADRCRLYYATNTLTDGLKIFVAKR